MTTKEKYEALRKRAVSSLTSGILSKEMLETILEHAFSLGGLDEIEKQLEELEKRGIK